MCDCPSLSLDRSLSSSSWSVRRSALQFESLKKVPTICDRFRGREAMRNAAAWHGRQGNRPSAPPARHRPSLVPRRHMCIIQAGRGTSYLQSQRMADIITLPVECVTRPKLQDIFCGRLHVNRPESVRKAIKSCSRVSSDTPG